MSRRVLLAARRRARKIAPQERQRLHELGSKLLYVRGPEPIQADQSPGDDDPGLLVAELEDTAAGCRWLLDRFAEYRRLLQSRTHWEEPTLLRFVRLLGKRVVEAVYDPVLNSIFVAWDVLVRQSAQKSWEQFCRSRSIPDPSHNRSQQWRAITPRPRDKSEAWGVLEVILSQQVERLQERLAEHEVNDAAMADDPTWMDRAAMDCSPEFERHRRSQSARTRELHRTLEILLKVRKQFQEGGMAEDRCPMAEDKWQMAEDRCPMAEDNRPMAEDNRQMAEAEVPAIGVVTPGADGPDEPVTSDEHTPEKVPNEAKLVSVQTQVGQRFESESRESERTQPAAAEAAPGKAVGEPVVTADVSGPEGHVDENPPGQETMAGNAGPDETVTPSTAKNLGSLPVATPARQPRSALTALAAATAAARMGPKMSLSGPVISQVGRKTGRLALFAAKVPGKLCRRHDQRGSRDQRRASDYNGCPVCSRLNPRGTARVCRIEDQTTMASDPDQLDLRQIRNIGIIAHIDAGKTTTTERVLYYTGEIHRMGDVDKGNTTTDYLEEERERGITIVAAAITCRWKDAAGQPIMINIIDTPGHVDFTAEVERSLRVLDGAVVIFSAVEGVEAQSETVWRQAAKYHVPRLCFINKMDRIGAEFERVYNEIQERLLESHPIPIQIPIGAGPEGTMGEFLGLIDLVVMKALHFKTEDLGSTFTVDEIPEELRLDAEAWRETMLNSLSAFDEKFAEEYMTHLDGAELPRP